MVSNINFLISLLNSHMKIKTDVSLHSITGTLTNTEVQRVKLLEEKQDLVLCRFQQ